MSEFHVKDFFERWGKGEFAEEHRRGISDCEWASMQQMGKPIYRKGQIVEFKVGGFGVITEISKAKGGWPCSYATKKVKGMKQHTSYKSAWHYEGDIKRLAGRFKSERIIY